VKRGAPGRRSCRPPREPGRNFGRVTRALSSCVFRSARSVARTISGSAARSPTPRQARVAAQSSVSAIPDALRNSLATGFGSADRACAFGPRPPKKPANASAAPRCRNRLRQRTSLVSQQSRSARRRSYSPKGSRARCGFVRRGEERARRKGRRVDLRATLRRSVARRGEPIDLKFRRRKPLPFVDLFAPAHDLKSLAGLERYLARLRDGRTRASP
jgi:hypothetical protein